MKSYYFVFVDGAVSFRETLEEALQYADEMEAAGHYVEMEIEVENV